MRLLIDDGRRLLMMKFRATRENGQRWDYGYDGVGQVTSGVKKFPGANGAAIPGHSFAYQYDGIGKHFSGTAASFPPDAPELRPCPAASRLHPHWVW